MNRVFDEVKKELLAADIDETVAYSFLSGAIRGAGELSFTTKGFALTFRHSDREFAEKILCALSKICDEKFKVEETYRDIAIVKKTEYVVAIPCEYAVDILERCEIVRSRCELVTTLPPSICGKSTQRKAYLKGLFLSCGYLGVPEEINDWRGGKSKGGYLLEFKLNSAIVMEPIKKLLEKTAMLNSGTALTRNRGSVLYVKKADAISRILVAMGSNSGVLYLQEIITERQFKNDVNRANNFDLANIDKTVSASERQIKEIEYIDSKIGLDSLPPILCETCRMRLTYPTAKLEELGRLFSPPISKSCINHRLRKISAIAAEI